MLFAAPWYLLGALGAVIPVLVHLFGRRRARRVAFSSLLLIKAAQRERTSLVRLRQVWLMVLRAAAILLLSLALARPTVPGVMVRGGMEEEISVVVDDTLSMRTRGPGGSAFAVAREAAEKLLEGMAEGTRVRVVRVSEVEQAQAGKAREMMATVARMEAGFGAAGVSRALRDLQGEVWVFGDLQRTAWAEGDGGARRAGGERREAAPLTAGGAGMTLKVVNCGREAVNRGVIRVEVRERPVVTGAATQLEVALSAGRAPEAVQVALRVGGAALPVAEVPSGVGRALFDWVPEQAGAMGVTATLAPDALREDDAGYAAVKVREGLRVLLVGTEAQTRHVRMALAPEGGGPMQVRVVGQETEADLAWAEVVGLWGEGGAGSRDRSRPADEAEAGLVLFAEGMPAATLERLAPGLRLGEARPLPHPLRLGWLEVFGGPLQAFGNPAAGDLQAVSVRVRRPVRIESAEGDWSVLARLEDGTPAVLGGHVARGRRVVLNLPLDPERSDLVTQGAFVPLMHRLCKWVARRGFDEVEGALAGGTVRLWGPEGATEVECFDPTGARVAVEVEGGAWRVRPLRPGLHRLSWRAKGKEQTTLLAVNVDPRESDLRRITEAELRDLMRPATVRVMKPEAVVKGVRGGPLGLATSLLVLAFLAMVAEMALAGRGAAARD